MSFEFKDKKQVEKDDIHRARKAGFFASVVFYLIPILGFMNVWAVAVREILQNLDGDLIGAAQSWHPPKL